VRANELLTSARRTGIEADASAGRLFRLAAVRLTEAPTESDEHRAAAADAGVALVGLALAEAEDELRGLLTPDPSDHNVVWTVACYQIGDLTPSALRDFPDPVEAVATVAACPDESHVAAELVASTAGGLRWTAVLRTNDHLAVQLPTPDTASDGSREHPGDLAAALRRWRQRLAAWSENSGQAADDPVTNPLRAAAGTAIVMPLAPVASPAARGPVGASSALDGRLDGLERRVGELVGRQDLDAVDRSISSRLGRLESSVAALAAGIEAANAAAARRDETVRQLGAELVAARAEDNSPALLREELEALQGMVDVRLGALATSVSDAIRRLDEIAGKLEQRTNRLSKYVRDIPFR
jgi:hypothetical protein